MPLGRWDDLDAFRLDDHRLAHVELARSMSVLIINGDPRTARNEDEPFFFAAALRNGLPRAAGSIKLPDDVSPESMIALLLCESALTLRRRRV